MKKTAKEILSDISGYSVDELKDRCSEPLIQPYDAELVAVSFAAQEVEEATKWVSVEERLPEMIEKLNYTRNVHAWCDNKLMIMCLCKIKSKYLWANCYNDPDGDGELDDKYEVTHWQPLPTPPKP